MSNILISQNHFYSNKSETECKVWKTLLYNYVFYGKTTVIYGTKSHAERRWSPCHEFIDLVILFANVESKYENFEKDIFFLQKVSHISEIKRSQVIFTKLLFYYERTKLVQPFTCLFKLYFFWADSWFIWRSKRMAQMRYWCCAKSRKLWKLLVPNDTYQQHALKKTKNSNWI